MHIERMHKMIECLTEKALAELDKGIENVDTKEMGEVVDMIKDLNEAEYRAVIVKSMKEADEEQKEYDKELLRALKDEYGEEGGRRYYDQYRYANGRFAPKGRGTRRGYEEPPYYHMPVNYNDMEYMRDMDKSRGKMYYSEPIAPHVSESNYDRAKRHYTETKEITDDLSWQVQRQLVNVYFSKRQNNVKKQITSKSPYRTSDTPIPRNPSFYERNKRRIHKLCKARNVSISFLYHNILIRVGEEFDLSAAEEIYEVENGYKPQYPMDMIDYFSDLSSLAEIYLDNLEKYI